MFVVSPAKRMDLVEGPPFARTRPAFLADAQRLASELRSLGYDAARDIWRCSDSLAMCFVNLSFHKTASVRFTRQREDSSRTGVALAPILSSPTTPRA